MSLFYRALPWLIPQLLLSARSGSEVALVSPWVADVSLQSPPLLHFDPNPRLSDLLSHLYQSRVSLILVIRERDHRLATLLRKIVSEAQPSIRVVTVEHIHAKAVVTERLALTTSANLLETSLYRNRETVSLRENPHGSARRWLAFEQDLHL